MKRFLGPKVMVAAVMALLMAVTLASTALATPQNWGASGGFRLTQRGATGNYVRAIQRVLQQRGYSITVDGVFGSDTESTVKSFQTSNGLTADGKVGAKTWTKLYNCLKYVEYDYEYGYAVTQGDGYTYFDYDYTDGPWWIRVMNGSWSIIME